MGALIREDETMAGDGAKKLKPMSMTRSANLILGVCVALASQAFSADSEILISKPPMRWLWGGFGFHNSEATMTGLMSEDFLNQRVLKTFLEISPTYARVFAGYHDWTKEAMDRFADYYDQTFRKAGTVLYLVPGRMPYIAKDFDIEKYCEDVAVRLEYLVKERNCTKIRYYCLSNEMCSGNEWGWFNDHLDLFKEYNECLYRAFRRHGLDGIGLMATDTSGLKLAEQIPWATKNMDQITDTYCWHLYINDMTPGDPALYGRVYDALTNLVKVVSYKEKRLCFGEFGITGKRNQRIMRDDSSYSCSHPAEARFSAIARAEMGLAALNAGCVNAVSWTMIDYPDPFLREDGDTAAEKARYDASRFSGHGTKIRYNKNGLVKWCDDEKDYSSYPDLYTMGYLVKLFRKDSRVLPWETKDPTLRVGAVTNPDGSATIAVINWGEAKNVRIVCGHPFAKPLRKYVYDSSAVPSSPFNDLQPASGTVAATDGVMTVAMASKSMIFLTTDYTDRTPSSVTGVKISREKLTWHASPDIEHRYYRVFKDGAQIASTVATSLAVDAPDAVYTVKSVDRWGNAIR